MATETRDRTPRPTTRAERLRASPPMFASPRLDRTTRVRVAVVPVVFLPVIAIQFALAAAELRAPALGAWMLAGYVLWTLAEYWLHRVVFHFEPARGLGARLHWMLHGVHHDHPNDPLRLVMPPSASLPLGTVVVLAFHLTLGFGAACALGAGFFVGYVVYDLTHYHVHHGRPRTTLGRRLREHHMRHHFQDGGTAFGVSSPVWDRIFGTAPRRRPS